MSHVHCCKTVLLILFPTLNTPRQAKADAAIAAPPTAAGGGYRQQDPSRLVTANSVLAGLRETQEVCLTVWLNIQNLVFKPEWKCNQYSTCTFFTSYPPSHAKCSIHYGDETGRMVGVLSSRCRRSIRGSTPHSQPTHKINCKIYILYLYWKQCLRPNDRFLQFHF